MRLFLLCLSVSFYLIGNAQVNFQNIPFEQALKRSAQESKIILLQFEAADCNQCNEVADKAFEHKDLAAQIESLFIPVKISADHPDRKVIGARYNIAKGFGTLFLNSEGVLLHRFGKTTSNWREYFKEIDVAMNKAGESLKISELEKEYKGGNRSIGFLEQLLQKKRSLNLPVNDLLDEYVSLLPEDSLKSVHTITFLIRMAPMFDSKAGVAMRKDRVVFKQAWDALPQHVRTGINNSIIIRGMEQAILEKSEAKALKIAQFAQGTNGLNHAAATKAYDMNMLRFYEKTGDTAKYFMKAIAYYERYFMIVSADSIKQRDSINLARIKQGEKRRDTIFPGNKPMIYASTSFRPMVQFFAKELNNGAWSFYKMTNNPYLLSVATEWIKKALEFDRTPEVQDTYAHLLYKQAQKDKAIEMETAAIELRRKRGYPTKEYEAVLDKMKKGLPIAD